ncbi:MAG TPA: carbohydrate ABC transporter substrate-binding protein, partial [Candidatus Angelobacter sp.]|nr:carbohydrate ABC transporter substrate-binding protein [Candidatus Angelobacter sp.]
FIKLAAGAAAAGPFFVFTPAAFASEKTLKVAKWAHFLPEFDDWFIKVMAADWGKQNRTEVTVDLIPVEEIRDRAFAEVAAGKGHDIFIFPWPPAEYHQHVIDHAVIYQMVAAKYGSIQQLAFRSTFNPATKKYFAFADFWMPSPLHFFQDYWAQVGMPLGPVHYGSLLSGGKQIRDKLGIPCGLAFSPTLEGNVTLHTILYSHRAWILDLGGNLLFNKDAFAARTLEYIRAINQQAGTPEQLTWGSGGSVRAMAGHKSSAAINAISLLRVAEKQDPDVAGKLWIQPPLIGSSGMGVTALPHVTNCSAIWSFARNQAGASKFLADMVDGSRTGYQKSLGCNFPIYPKTVPDLIVRLTKDPQANPPSKYTALKDALHWTPNLGVPGFATPAYMEIFNTSVVPKMLARAVKGEQSAEDAVAAGAAEMRRIIDKWQQAS